MLVSNTEVRSGLYGTLADLGALATENTRIRRARGNVSGLRREIVEMSTKSFNDGTQRIMYEHPWFRIDRCDHTQLEIWVNGNEFIGDSEILWIDAPSGLFGVLPRDYDIELSKVHVVHNLGICDRYSVVAEASSEYTHYYEFDVSKAPFCNMDDPFNCVVCIADGAFTRPELSRIEGEDTVYAFSCPYTRTLDMIVYMNLVSFVEAKANVGCPVDNVYSNYCYHAIVIDEDPEYPIDARFYPYIKVDKDCFVRTFNASKHHVPNPTLTRLVNYEEFSGIEDPYNSNNAYLENLPDVEDIIEVFDTDEEIIEKFRRLVPYWYRIYEAFRPQDDAEQSNFVVCDNSRWVGEPTFFRETLVRRGGERSEVIISNVPAETHRDILFHNGRMFNDHEILKVRQTEDGAWIESALGTDRYVIPGNYDEGSFTVVKFNAFEDTVFSNIAGEIDRNNLVKLHRRLNRFYRNMLVLRGTVIDSRTDVTDRVRVSHSEPTEKDQYLWFELLVNAVPEMFEKRAIETIDLLGLDVDSIPEPIRRGAYGLQLEPGDGPKAYTDLLYTYFNITDELRDHLVVEEHDPRIRILESITRGALPDDPTPGDVNLNDPSMGSTETITRTFDGTTDDPRTTGHDVGDLYLKLSNPGDTKPIKYDRQEISDIYRIDPFDVFDQEEDSRSIADGVLMSLTRSQKIALVESYITEGTDEEKESIRTLWHRYLASMDEDVLDETVYRVLMTDFIYTKAKSGSVSDEPVRGSTIIFNRTEPTDVEKGDYWLESDIDLPGRFGVTLQGDGDEVQRNVRYILSERELGVKRIGDLWIDVPAIGLQKYAQEIITSIWETNNRSGLPEPPDPDDGGEFTRSATVFDYGAHGSNEALVPELTEVEDDGLHEVHYGTAPTNPEDGAIWYEFLDEVENRVCYSDTESMVLRIDEHLWMVEFDGSEITAFVFDDVVMNFNGRLGIRYLSVVADLVRSGSIPEKDLNVFYGRLITEGDDVRPALGRLFTGRDHVVSMLDVDPTNYCVTYSNNIGRFHIDYTDPNLSVIERQATYRHMLDLRNRELSFIGQRMLLFVNGRYVSRTEYDEPVGGMIRLLGFDEIISCVDVFYNRRDRWLVTLKEIAQKHIAKGPPGGTSRYYLTGEDRDIHLDENAEGMFMFEDLDTGRREEYVTLGKLNIGDEPLYVPDEDTSEYLSRPETNYGTMEPIRIRNRTKRGFYDVLIEEFIRNGRMGRLLRYLAKHPEEINREARDMVQNFHMISDMDICSRDPSDARIVIVANGGADAPYQIR